MTDDQVDSMLCAFAAAADLRARQALADSAPRSTPAPDDPTVHVITSCEEHR